jgi:hypothetical protein
VKTIFMPSAFMCDKCQFDFGWGTMRRYGFGAFQPFGKAARNLLEGNKAESVVAINRTVASGFSDPEALFYAGRHLAHLGETDGAFALLERVVKGGFFCYPALAADPWLAGLRKKPAFTKLLKQAETQHKDAADAFANLGGAKLLAQK